MGRAVAPRVAGRFGRLLLELGGNNATIVAPSADLDLAVRGIVFAAAGTAGQRCTSLRRLIVHVTSPTNWSAGCERAYATLPVGVAAGGRHAGRAADRSAPPTSGMQAALGKAAGRRRRRVAGGERVLADERTRRATTSSRRSCGCRRRPPSCARETFAPILYVLTYRRLRRGDRPAQRRAAGPVVVDLHERTCARPSGSSRRTAPTAASPTSTSGPSGAEIGGAFGGEKETGGGRESGSDAWRAYMRRATNTVNYSTELPLAQGVEFL